MLIAIRIVALAIMNLTRYLIETTEFCGPAGCLVNNCYHVRNNVAIVVVLYE